MRYFVLLCVLVNYLKQSECSIPCPPLPFSPGAVISCEGPTDHKRIPCTGPITGVPKRTVAKYRCEGDSDFSDNVVECKCRGKWKGLADFQNYTSKCGSIQHSFSLDGPPELNLTNEEIQLLDGDSTNINLNGSIPAYALDALAYHNYYRKLHGASPLELNASLFEAAKNWAAHEASSDHFGPEPWSVNKSYISNIYKLTGPDNFDPSIAARLAVGRWYSSGSSYDYDVPVANAFSAMLWNSTTDLGVGIVSNGHDVLVVANYWPPGNVYVVGGQNSVALFKKNVFPLVNNTNTNN